jgi:uncharacterized protein (DUF983 family)
MLLLVYAALGVVLGVFTLLVAERERRKRGASRWSWMMVWAFGIVLLCLSLLRLIVVVSS